MCKMEMLLKQDWNRIQNNIIAMEIAAMAKHAYEEYTTWFFMMKERGWDPDTSTTMSYYYGMMEAHAHTLSLMGFPELYKSMETIYEAFPFVEYDFENLPF